MRVRNRSGISLDAGEQHAAAVEAVRKSWHVLHRLKIKTRTTQGTYEPLEYNLIRVGDFVEAVVFVDIASHMPRNNKPSKNTIDFAMTDVIRLCSGREYGRVSAVLTSVNRGSLLTDILAIVSVQRRRHSRKNVCILQKNRYLFQSPKLYDSTPNNYLRSRRCSSQSSDWFESDCG